MYGSLLLNLVSKVDSLRFKVVDEGSSVRKEVASDVIEAVGRISSR